MRKNILAIVFVTALLALSGYGQTDNLFVSKDGKFTAIPPEGFDRSKVEKHTSASGDVIYSMDLERGACMMAYSNLPDDTLKTKSTQKMLEDGRDGAVKGAEGTTVDSQENLTVDGYPALSFNTHVLSDKTMVYSRMVFVVANSRIYGFLFISTNKAEITKPDVVKFFNSIHIQK